MQSSPTHIVILLIPFFINGMHSAYPNLPPIIPYICQYPHSQVTNNTLRTFAEACYETINKKRKEKQKNGTLPQDEQCLIDKPPFWNIGHETSVYTDRIFIMPSNKLDRLNIPHTICFLILLRDQKLKARYGNLPPCFHPKNQQYYSNTCGDVQDSIMKESILNAICITDAHDTAHRYNPYSHYTHTLLKDISKTRHKDEYVLSRSHTPNLGITFEQLAVMYNGIKVSAQDHEKYLQDLRALLPQRHVHFRDKKSVGLLIHTTPPTSAYQHTIFPDENHSPCYEHKHKRDKR